MEILYDIFLINEAHYSDRIYPPAPGCRELGQEGKMSHLVFVLELGAEFSEWSWRL